MAAEDDNVETESKREVVLKRLQERRDEREAELLKQKDEKKPSAENETIQYFESTFQTSVDEIKRLVAGAVSTPKDNLTMLFDNLVCKHADLQKFLSDSAFFLTSHDLSVKQQLLTGLFTEINSERQKFFPKKKFTFKNKKKQSATSEPKSATATTAKAERKDETSTSIPNYDILASEYRVQSQSNQTISLSAEEIENKDVIVSELSHCRLIIKGSPTAIHLNDLTGCTVISTPCSR